MTPEPKKRKPWPMKWVLVTIIAVLVPYTYLTLHYRKPGPAYRPYQDAQDRANVVRLLDAGYRRITVAAERPADPVKGLSVAATLPATGGLPEGLTKTLVQLPLLPAEIIKVATTGASKSDQPYAVQFTCALPDNKQQLAGACLYIRDDEIIIAPDFELLAGGLLARSRESAILLTVPAGSFKPGQYRVTLVGQRASRAWALQVH